MISFNCKIIFVSVAFFVVVEVLVHVVYFVCLQQMCSLHLIVLSLLFFMDFYSIIQLNLWLDSITDYFSLSAYPIILLNN